MGLRRQLWQRLKALEPRETLSGNHVESVDSTILASLRNLDAFSTPPASDLFATSREGFRRFAEGIPCLQRRRKGVAHKCRKENSFPAAACSYGLARARAAARVSKNARRQKIPRPTNQRLGKPWVVSKSEKTPWSNQIKRNQKHAH